MRSVFQSKAYNLAARLNGHSDAIYTLAVSPSGNLLASGGKPISHHLSHIIIALLTFMPAAGDGVRIWNMKTMKELHSLPHSRFYRGPVSCIEWITCRDDMLETLAFGTGLGWLEIWREVSVMVRSQHLEFEPYLKSDNRAHTMNYTPGDSPPGKKLSASQATLVTMARELRWVLGTVWFWLW